MLSLTKSLFHFSFTYPCPRKLREIMKMSMIQRQTPSRIAEIWNEYHAARPSNISAVLTKDQYNFLTRRGTSAKFFIIPVFKKQGHFKLLTQWQKDCFLCTFMQDFKRKGANASPYMVFTLFPELLFHKGVVLVRGDIINNNNLAKQDASNIWKNLSDSYTIQSRFEMVHKFNNEPTRFDQQQYNQLFGINQ